MSHVDKESKSYLQALKKSKADILPTDHHWLLIT